MRSMLEPRSDQRAVFDLADAIRPVITSFRTIGLDVRVAVPCGIEIEGRRDDTAQVVFTLLDNARKHAAMSAVEFRVAVCGSATTLFIEDDGTGIPRGLGQRLFERGVRGDGSAGRGLGLFIARRLMVDQGGDRSTPRPDPVAVRRSRGIPHRPSSSHKRVRLDPPARGRDLMTGRILVVEDHALVAIGLQLALSARGWDVETTTARRPPISSATPNSSSRSAYCSTSASASSSAAAST